jgi:hypothetical protein
MESINGKYYPLWSQFVDRKAEWIGGTLEDFGDSFDSAFGLSGSTTTITDIALEPNGKEHAAFSVIGANFTCGGSTEYLGVVGGEPGWITLRGYGGHTWRFKQKEWSENP